MVLNNITSTNLGGKLSSQKIQLEEAQVGLGLADVEGEARETSQFQLIRTTSWMLLLLVAEVANRRGMYVSRALRRRRKGLRYKTIVGFIVAPGTYSLQVAKRLLLFVFSSASPFLHSSKQRSWDIEFALIFR